MDSNHESRLSRLEEKLNHHVNVMDEVKQDMEHLEVADRLHKRLENNLSRLVNKLDKVTDQLPGVCEEASNNHQLTTNNTNQLQQFFNYKIDESIYQMRTEVNEMKKQLKIIKDDQESMNAKIDKVYSFLEDIVNPPSKTGNVWIINGMEAKLKWPTMTEFSPVMKIYGYPFAAQLVMQTKNNDVFLYMSFKDTGNFRAFSACKHLPRAIFSVCDIGVNHEANDIVKIYDPPFGQANYQYNVNYYSLCLCQKSDILIPKYLFNDSITLKAEIVLAEEPPASVNGVLLWTVDNYQKRRKMEENHLQSCQHSPTFYTSERGYRVKAELELRFGMLKVRICFVSGEFDADLNAAFSHTATVTLCDQSPSWFSRSNPSVTVRKSNIQDRCYEVNLSLPSDLNDFKENYIKDDAITLKIEIQSSVPS